MKENREKFIKQVLRKEKSMSALCREYDISRPTGYKWLKRYEAGEELDDRSRRPFNTPNMIPAETEERIVAGRKREPAIGAVKAQRMFINQGWTDPPSVSTFNAVYRRNGLITKENSEKATPYKRFEKESPNMMWQADFKGYFVMKDGKRCDPLSILDDCSRFCINGDAKSNMKLEGTKASFIAAFREYGLPESLLCDNGVPWGSSQSSAITHFEVWLMELGVLTLHIRFRHPQTQGKVERFNGSYKQERLKFYTPKDINDAQKCREEYREFYNYQRPHHALDLDTPAQRYHASERRYPDVIQPWVYDEGVTVRKIKSTGYLTHNAQGYFLSEGLGGKEVALVPSHDKDGVLNVLFRQFTVATLDMNNNVVISRKLRRTPRRT